jgi:hypothetical protein
MKPSLQTATLVVLALLAVGASTQQLIDDRNYYCRDVTFDNYTLSPQQLKDRRDDTYTDFYTDYNRLFDFARDPSSNTFIGLYRYQFGLLLTLELLILLSLIFFLISLCVRIRCRCNCWWECLWLFILFFIIFVGLYIAMLVFIGISQNHTGPAYCAIHTLPATLLYGNPGTPSRQEFIGYQPLMNLIGNFSSEVQGLSRVQTNARGIVGANLPVQTNALLQNQVRTWRTLSANQIAGVNGNVFADTFIRNSAAGPSVIENEFATLDNLARALYNTASQVQFLGSTWYAADSVVALNGMRSQLQSSFNDYQSAANTFTYRAMQIQSWAIGAFWTFFAVAIVIIILCIAVIIAFCEVKRGKCLGCIRAMKWILIFLTFLILIYGITVLILMAGVAGMSPFCKFVAELNQGGWNAANTFENMFNRNNGTSAINNTNPGALLKYCFYKNSTGYIPSLFNTTAYVTNSYDRLISIVNGIVVYRNYLRVYNGFTQTASPAISAYTASLGNLTSGDLYDNTAVYLANKDLNNLVSCSGNQFAWTANGCNNYFWSSCSAFANGFTVPACSTNQTIANGYYNNIRNAVASEATLVNAITTGLGPINTQYAAIIAAFAAQQANVNAIQAALPGTLNSVSAYNNTLQEIVDCTSLQVELVQFERYVCFPFVKPLYVLLVLACISLFFLFLLPWTLWAILVTRDESVDTIVVVRKEEFLAVSEQELVPKY